MIEHAAGRTALVTGGAGYIGAHTVLALLDEGWGVVVLDDLSTGDRSLVPPEVAFVEGDVGDFDLVTTLLRDRGVDVVLHLAGSISAAESVTDPLRYFDNNTGRSRALISAMTTAGTTKLVFSSSAAVYGAPATSLVDEDAATRPLNPYGASKLMTEQMLAFAASAHDLRYVALRYFNVAGADPLGRAGPPRGAPRSSLLDVALDAAAGSRAFVPIFGADHPTIDGTGVRDFIHVSDLAQAHLAALDLLDGPPGPDVLNVGYGRGRSVLELLTAVRRVTGECVTANFEARRPGDPAEVVADNRRLLQSTRWRPHRAALEDIVADAWRWRIAGAAPNKMEL